MSEYDHDDGLPDADTRLTRCLEAELARLDAENERLRGIEAAHAVLQAHALAIAEERDRLLAEAPCRPAEPCPDVPCPPGCPAGGDTESIARALAVAVDRVHVTGREWSARRWAAIARGEEPGDEHEADRPRTPVPDFLAIGAFRYALGRMTYVVAETCDWLCGHWGELSPEARRVIGRDLERAYDRDGRAAGLPAGPASPLGMDCDRAQWDRVRALCEAAKAGGER